MSLSALLDFAPVWLFVPGRLFWANTAKPAAVPLVLFSHRSHNVFTDRRYFDSAKVATSVKVSTWRLTLAFLQSLDGKQGRRFSALSAFKEPGLVLRSAQGAQQVAVANTRRIGLPSPARSGAP